MAPDKLDGTMYTAFFYLQSTQTRGDSPYINQIDTYRKKLRHFNFGLSVCTHEKTQNFPPKLIVVSDDIFTLPDQDLNQIARFVVPSYYRPDKNDQ